MVLWVKLVCLDRAELLDKNHMCRVEGVVVRQLLGLPGCRLSHGLQT